jgi:hypothetical protein
MTHLLCEFFKIGFKTLEVVDSSRPGRTLDPGVICSNTMSVEEIEVYFNLVGLLQEIANGLGELWSLGLVLVTDVFASGERKSVD